MSATVSLMNVVSLIFSGKTYTRCSLFDLGEMESQTGMFNFRPSLFLVTLCVLAVLVEEACGT